MWLVAEKKFRNPLFFTIKYKSPGGPYIVHEPQDVQIIFFFMYIFKYISGGHAQPGAPVHLLYLILKAVYLKGKVQNIFLPLHSIYRVSEFCRYDSGCQYSNLL